MNHDLRRSMHELGSSERDHLPELSVDLLRRRAHRARVVRTTAHTAVGAGTAAAVVIGGVAVADALGDREPTPVATEPAPGPTPTRTPRPAPAPTPTPTSTATQPPEPVWEPGWAACGSTVVPTTVYDGPDDITWWDDGIVLWGSSEGYVAPPSDPSFTLALDLASIPYAGQQVTVTVVDVQAAYYEAAQDAWVVDGIAAAPLGSVDVGIMPAFDPNSYEGWDLTPVEVALTSCSASPTTAPAPTAGSLEEPLTRDDYGVFVTAEVTTADGTTETVRELVAGIGEEGEVEDPSGDDPEPPTTPPAGQTRDLTVGSPLRLGWAETRNNASQLNPWDPELEQWCGKDAASLGVATGTNPAGAPFALGGNAFVDANRELILQVTATSTRAPFENARVMYPFITVVKDGRVIGRAADYDDTFRIPAMQPGEAVQLELSIGQFTCTFMFGEYWPAGTYQLYTSLAVSEPAPGMTGVLYAPMAEFTLP